MGNCNGKTEYTVHDVKAIKIALITACENQDIETVKKLLYKEIDMNIGYLYNKTPLYHAVKISKPNLDMISLLINYGADPNIQDWNGYTSLHMCKNTDVAKLLLNAGANLNACDWYNCTSLHTISNQEIISVLIENGADIEATDKYDNTPLFNSCFLGNIEKAKLLIEKGANVNAINKRGETPLHDAVSSKYYTIVELLINNGVNINMIDQYGYTPLHRACGIHDCYDDIWLMIELLINKGADINLTTKTGKTIFDIARESNIFYNLPESVKRPGEDILKLFSDNIIK
jgi:ankyrin repeat protein